MWQWDQGHTAYFQFENLRRVAIFVTSHNFLSASKAELTAATGLTFSAPSTHDPWRQYARALRASLLMSEVGGVPTPTALAGVLATPGAVTSDEYWDYLIRVTTHPSPAFSNWSPTALVRHPLLFALKYLLAKSFVEGDVPSSLGEIIGAYATTPLTGGEGQTDFISILGHASTYEQAYADMGERRTRQSRESLQAMAQLSFLSIRNRRIHVALNSGDADTIFEQLDPIIGIREDDRDAEIRRLAEPFREGTTADYFDYPSTTLDVVIESGFAEGGKVERSHFVIERNATIRREYFSVNPTTACDVCLVDTNASYPWTSRVLDLHHLLPLSAGTRVEGGNTTFDDLVPLCPTCHRAVHRFYSSWLRARDQKDFSGTDEARGVYEKVKFEFPGLKHG